jgi:hypothetical protein
MPLKRCAYRRLAVSFSLLPAQAQRDLARFFAPRAGDGLGLHHRAAVHLPELLRVQLRQQFAQRQCGSGVRDRR